MELLKKIIKILKKQYKIFIIIPLIIFLIILNYFYISFTTQNQNSSNLTKVPNYKVGLLLGTSSKVKSGQPNQYFTNRIKAAVELYELNKIEIILVSGDNSDSKYNEPIKMKQALVLNGIPESAIFLDYAGFDTLDSVVRSKKIFGQNEIIIISQKFHNQRALYISNFIGLNAYGYNAKDPNTTTFKIYLRETLARIKVIFELHILNQGPKFLGEPIQI